MVGSSGWQIGDMYVISPFFLVQHAQLVHCTPFTLNSIQKSHIHLIDVFSKVFEDINQSEQILIIYPCV